MAQKVLEKVCPCLTGVDRKVFYIYWQVCKSTDEFLNLSLELSNPENFSLEVLSFDGKLLSQLADEIRIDGNFERRFSLEMLPAAEYLLLFRIGNFVQTKRIVKRNGMLI